MTPIISTAQHLSLTGPEHWPFWGLLGVGGGHGFRGIISESYDGILGYIIHRQCYIKGKKTTWKRDMIWVRYGWIEWGDPAWYGATTRQSAGLWSGPQDLGTYRPLVTMLVHILSSFWALQISMEEGIWIGVHQSPLFGIPSTILEVLSAISLPYPYGLEYELPQYIFIASWNS